MPLSLTHWAFKCRNFHDRYKPVSKEMLKGMQRREPEWGAALPSVGGLQERAFMVTVERWKFSLVPAYTVAFAGDWNKNKNKTQ